jgi:hypothetical protein
MTAKAPDTTASPLFTKGGRATARQGFVYSVVMRNFLMKYQKATSAPSMSQAFKAIDIKLMILLKYIQELLWLKLKLNLGL